ncbi:DUF1674 domain-containing protein [Kordiimonas laminariae]|uniref:DUF1674 domain-containing protein n=1 Tax=Kordiimonas laminariae TaxID=2917717 RepID=UPI001FF45559|nr:DUF1674 domain-containing protein [Kordiimonas laminariae]MCK0070268.1 DUF1674 domain-containing protein [Kordiimonas laminariae]
MTEKENKKPVEKTSEQVEKKEGEAPKEIGGREGLEPTRYGDWEHGGIISDF